MDRGVDLIKPAWLVNLKNPQGLPLPTMDISPMRIATVVGARPQFVKAAPMSAALSRAGIDEIGIHTGQHFDATMSDIFFTELGIPEPRHMLNIHGGNHGEMTGRMLAAIEAVLLAEKPDAALVYGDTNSTLAGALAAAKLHIPVVHVEAGLRSYNRAMPEEVNRVLTDHASRLLLCPTSRACKNLQAEGITEGVHQVGDLMYDATLQMTPTAIQKSDLIERLGLFPKNYGVATIHRAENTSDASSLRRAISYLEKMAERFPIVFPVHPRTKAIMERNAMSIDPSQIIVSDPIGYLDMQALLSQALLLVTDSGGMQKEAYFHRVECVTMRSETEWVETIEAGWNRLWTSDIYQSRTEIDEYGTGSAADQIVKVLKSELRA